MTTGDGEQGDGWPEARYWRARALEVERRLVEARTRLLALGRMLPPELVEMLETDVESLPADDWNESAVVGIIDSHSFVPGDVADELDRVWQRLRRPRAGRARNEGGK